MTFQHSTDAEETPTAETSRSKTLRDVLDGSIRIDGEKVPIDVPRVRDTDAEEERSLESYQAMKRLGIGEDLLKALMLGVSQEDYKQVAGQFVDGFGLSQSSVSRRFLWAGPAGARGV